MKNAIHTSDCRRAQKLWLILGGQMIPVRRTGEMRYTHPAFDHSVRANDRRSDVPAVLLSRINQILKTRAANDPVWDLVR